MWMGIIHHIVVAIYSTYLMWNSCQSDKGNSRPSVNGGSFTASGKHFGWWRDDTCLMEANKGYVFNVMISMGFMTVEFLIVTFQIEKLSSLNR